MHDIVPIPVKESPAVLVYITIAAVTLMLAIVLGYYRDQSLKIISAAFNARKKGALSRTDSEMVSKVGRYLSLIFYVNLLLFLYAIHYRFDTQLKISNQQYVLLSIGVVLFFILKNVLHYFLAIIFKTQDYAQLYLEDSQLKYRFFGILLFPLVLMTLFSQHLSQFAVISGVIGFLVIWLVKSYFGLRLGLMSKSFPKHYSFVYICTLEILPIALLCKIFIGPINSLLS